jgi:uncharacterized protein CbrC (UPF0167 family)
MVRWRDAVAGLTHGRPLPPRADGSPPTLHHGFPAEAPNAEGWQRIRVESELLQSLVLTPDFESIQGSEWKFHCGHPMAFIGRWGKADFRQHAPDGDGAAFAQRVAELHADAYDALGESGSDEDAFVWAYGFRCTVCDAVAANWDVD